MTASAPGYLFRGFGVSLSQAPTHLHHSTRCATRCRSRCCSTGSGRATATSRPSSRSPSPGPARRASTSDGRRRGRPRASIRRWWIGFAICSRSRCPRCLAGRFRVAAFETGDRRRPAQEGWVNLTFYPQLGGAFGTSTVGGNSGTMSIRYGMVSSPTTNPNNCMTPEVSIADHEITHTMGFWHTPDIFARYVLRHRLSRRAAPRLHPLSLGADVLAAGRQSRSGHRPGPGHRRSRAWRRGPWPWSRATTPSPAVAEPSAPPITRSLVEVNDASRTLFGTRRPDTGRRAT